MVSLAMHSGFREREKATVVLERNEEREVVGRIWGEERKNQYKIKCYFFN